MNAEQLHLQRAGNARNEDEYCRRADELDVAGKITAAKHWFNSNSLSCEVYS